MPVHVPGPELGGTIPFKHLGGQGKHGRKGVSASLNLTAFVDMMTMLVVFLLMTFSATGEILLSQKGLELPQAINDMQLQRAPIVTITTDSITFNGEPMADPRTIMADTSMDFKIIELLERLKVESTKFELQPMEEPEREALRGTLIVQADKNVDAKVLNRVMKTCFVAQYPNIMFAVNRRSARK